MDLARHFIPPMETHLLVWGNNLTDFRLKGDFSRPAGPTETSCCLLFWFLQNWRQQFVSCRWRVTGHTENTLFLCVTANFMGQSAVSVFTCITFIFPKTTIAQKGNDTTVATNDFNFNLCLSCCSLMFLPLSVCSFVCTSPNYLMNQDMDFSKMSTTH